MPTHRFHGTISWMFCYPSIFFPFYIEANNEQLKKSSFLQKKKKTFVVYVMIKRVLAHLLRPKTDIHFLSYSLLQKNKKKKNIFFHFNVFTLWYKRIMSRQLIQRVTLNDYNIISKTVNCYHDNIMTRA